MIQENQVLIVIVKVKLLFIPLLNYNQRGFNKLQTRRSRPKGLPNSFAAAKSFLP
jgi:hypothetical protein